MYAFFRSHSQNSDIKNIHFHYNRSNIINSDIDIYFYQEIKNNTVKVSVNKYKNNNEYTISSKKFSELIKSVLKISLKDVIQDIRSCLDGEDMEISFSTTCYMPTNEVIYKTSCLSTEDEKTVLKDYLSAVNLVLEVSKLKFTDLE